MYHIAKNRFERNQEAYRKILSERAYRIVHARFMENKTYTAIGELEGISDTRIRQIVGKACYDLHNSGYGTDGKETFV